MSQAAAVRVVVVGGGVVGLGVAAMLADIGCSVTGVERDEDDAMSVDDAWLRWRRPGVPQLRQVHSFSASAHEVLSRCLPDVLDAVEGWGADTGVLRVRSGDDETVIGRVLRCRRTTLEHALWQAVRGRGVEWLRGRTVSTVSVSSGGGAAVTGVTLSDGATLPADIVVNAGGANSRLIVGAERVSLDRETRPLDLTYLTCWYRLRPGRQLPVEGVRANVDYATFALTPADGPWMSMTVVGWRHDRLVRAMGDRAVADDVAALVDPIAEWVDPKVATSTGGSLHAPRLRNSIARHVGRSIGMPAGLVSVGDAAAATNPMFARGTGLGLLHAAALVESLGGSSSISDVTDAYHQALQELAVAWYAESCAFDDALVLRLKAASGADLTPGERDSLLSDRASTYYWLPFAAREIPAVMLANLRYLNTVGPASTVTRCPELKKFRAGRQNPALPEPNRDLRRRLEEAAGLRAGVSMRGVR